MTAEPTPRRCQCWFQDCVSSGSVICAVLRLCAVLCNAAAESFFSWTPLLKVNPDDLKGQLDRELWRRWSRSQLVLDVSHDVKMISFWE